MKTLCLIALIIIGASATFNYQQCAKDSFALGQSVQTYLKSMQNMNYNIEDLTNEIQTMVQNAQNIIIDCPVPEQAASSLPQASGNCLNDLKALTEICEKAVNDYEAKNIFALVGDAEAIVKEGKLTLADCKSADQTVAQKPKLQAFTQSCQTQSVQYGLDLHRFYKIAQENLTPAVWNDFLDSTSQLLQDTQNLIQECGLNFQDDGTISVDISANCIQDISTLTTDVEKAISDYNSGNIIALAKDAAQIMIVANKTLQDCTTSQLEYEIQIALMNNPQINYEKCAKDAFTFVQACEKFINDIQNGTDSHNLPQILSDIQAIVTSGQALVVDCGFNSTTTAPFANFDASILDVQISAACQKDLEVLSVDVAKAVKDYEEKNIIGLVKEAEKIIKEANQALTDCKSNFLDQIMIALQINPTINYEKCAIDAFHFGQACYTFVEDIKNGTDASNLPQILTDVQNIVTSAQALVTDCGINATDATQLFVEFDASLISVANPITCAKDLETLATDVQKAIKDFEAKNIIALVKDAEQIITLANKTLIDCKSTLPAFAEQQLPISIQMDLETCFSDNDKFVAQVKEFIAFSISGNLEDVAIAAQINQLMAVSQEMLDGCGVAIDLSQIVPLNAGGCIGDIVSVAQLAGAAVKDLLTFQYQAVVYDLVGLISEASQAITDCIAQDSDSAANNVIFACIHGADTFVTLIEQFQADYTKGDDFQAIVQDSSNIAQYVPVLLNTCAAGKAAAFYTKYLPDDCIVSLQQTADAGYGIYEVRNNFFNILRALPALADALESDLNTCPLLKRKL